MTRHRGHHSVILPHIAVNARYVVFILVKESPLVIWYIKRQTILNHLHFEANLRFKALRFAAMNVEALR